MKTMEDGWIKLWRKSFDSAVWKNKNLWRLWTYCLLKANHERKWVSVKTGEYETEVEVLPGQFVFGRNIAAKDTKLYPSTVNYLMQKLKFSRNIDIQSNTHYSIVSILNWDTYQHKENRIEQALKPELDTHLTPTEQAPDTNKNDKNVKNYTNEHFEEFWRTYPKKKNKGQAEKSWQKIKPGLELKERILAGVEIAKKSDDWIKEGGQYIPYPATWLNAKGWEDEYKKKDKW